MDKIHSIKLIFLTKPLRYALRFLILIAGILLLFYLLLFIYFSVNKKAILKQISTDISKNVRGKVSIGDIDFGFIRTFPHPSILIHNISVADSQFYRHHQLFFSADKLYAELSFFALLKKNFDISGIRIEKGAIRMYTDSSGYTNMYLLQQSADSPGNSDSTNAEKNTLNKIDLIDFSVTFIDEKDKKLYDGMVHHLKLKISQSDTAIYFAARADISINHLEFKTTNGSFLAGKNFKGNFDFAVTENLRQLYFDSINVTINNHPYNISGDFGLTKENRLFNLRVHTKNLLYNEGKSLLTPQISSSISIVDIDKPVDADAAISGLLNGGNPLIFLKWKVSDTHLTTPVLNFDQASFTGYYTNEVAKGKPRTDSNSEIHVNNFSAQWNRFPVTSDNIEIMNLSRALLTCDLKSEFPVARFNDFFQNKTILFKSGNASVNVTYSGLLEKNKNTHSMVNGTISFKDGDMVYLPKEVEMKNVGGGLRIKNSDVYINNFRFDIFNNIVILTGEMKNLVTLLTTEPDKAVINWDIYSPGLNLEPLIHLLKAKHTSAENNRKEVNDIVSGIDNMLEHGSIRVSLKTPRVVYKKFEATAVNADITFMPNRYIIHKVELDHADGHVNFNGTIDNRRDNEHEANVNATLQDADVRKIFHAFNDFGQDAIKQYNIAGRLNANIGVHLLFDDAGNPNTDSLRSMVDFSLEKGALYNFEPLKKIQSFIFKDRNLDSVKFAELRDRLTIAGHRIKIDRMEIESTALTMYVEGVYGIKGNTDITIQLPLRNLKKHDQGYQPQNQGVNNGGGLSFYIHAVSGPDGRMQFKPEFFHFLKKRKQAIH